MITDALPGFADFLGFFVRQFDHFFRHAFSHQFVRVVLVGKASLGFFDFGIARVRGHTQYLVGLGNWLDLLPVPARGATDKVD